MIVTKPTALAAFPVVSLPAVMLASLLIVSASAPAQVRPTIMNPGEASETPKQPPRVDRSRVGPTRASKPSFSVLVVLTEPKSAEIRIDGRPAGKSQDGRFTTELPPSKRYKISVSAGPDYLEYEKVVTLKLREPAIVEAPLTPRYGTIRIFPARGGVNLLDNDQPVPAEKRTVDNDQRIVLGRITPGGHKITYDLPGYVLYQRSFNVTPGSEHTWNFEPERAVTELTVVTEPGTTIYVDNKQVGNTPANGRLAYIAELGSHQVKLVKEDFEEYSETKEFRYREPVILEKRLVPLPTSAGFDDNFDLPKPKLWTLPEGLAFKDKRLYVENARALGTPTGYRYRDFEMSFHLRLVNAGGAAWAVRVKDSNNYYLFYLAGPQGLFANTFNTYIVRNNEFDPRNPVESHEVPARLARLVAGGQYRIHIKGTRNRIEHQITPTESGETVNLGFYEDKDSTFLLGGIGFRTVALETFSIDDLFVFPR